MNEETKQLTTVVQSTPESLAFVETDKMFERFAAITRETAARAYDFFAQRGSELGSTIEDWLRAESETLRSAPVKITESSNMVNVMIAVPGFKADEIEVSVKGDLLMVSGESKAETKSKDEDTYYSEWRSDRFMRKLTLPSQVDTNNVEAKLKDGILNLALRKSAEIEAAKVAVQSA